MCFLRAPLDRRTAARLEIGHHFSLPEKSLQQSAGQNDGGGSLKRPNLRAISLADAAFVADRSANIAPHAH